MKYLLPLALLAASCVSGGDPPPVPMDVPDAVLEDVSELPAPPDIHVGDAGPEVVCGGPPPTKGAFPAAEVGVRITTPTGLRGVLLSAPSVVLGGVSFGPVKTLGWTRGTASGSIALDDFFWKSAPIPLEPGDNVITVTAEGGGQTSSDRIVVTSRASPLAGLRLHVSPDHVWVGEDHSVRVTLALPAGTATPTAIALVRVDPEGVEKSAAGTLADDGDSASPTRCDEVAGDRVYSACWPAPVATVGPICLRARLTLAGAPDPVETPTACIDALARLTQAECASVVTAMADAKSAYDGAGDHVSGLIAAQSSLTTAGASAVGKAVDEKGLWVRFPSGVLGALPLGLPPGTRGAPFGAATGSATIGSRRALLMRARDLPDEIDAAGALLAASKCPSFDLDGPKVGGATTLEDFRQLAGRGIVAFSGHGGAFFTGLATDYGWRHAGTQEVLWTASPLQCTELVEHTLTCNKPSDCPAGTTCVVVAGGSLAGECIQRTAADLLRGRAVVGTDGVGVTPAMIEHYAEDRLPRSLVYAGACQSLWNGSLAMAFLGAGANAYAGYSGFVRDDYAIDMGTRLFTGLVEGLDSAEKAMCWSSDPQDLSSAFRIAGALGVSLDNPGIINPGFEAPDLEGWTLDGDVRRMSSFCGASAAEGKFLALLSTGLGFTQNHGRLSQTFCIPKGAQSMTFAWRYYSAELEVSCGTPYQDRWKVLLKSEDVAEAVPLLDCKVDDMCFYSAGQCIPKGCKGPPSDCSCGKCYQPYEAVGECDFEGAAVMATAFVTQSVNISALAGGGPVTLTVQVEDKGQPTNDTAILLDDIQFK